MAFTPAHRSGAAASRFPLLCALSHTIAGAARGCGCSGSKGVRPGGASWFLRQPLRKGAVAGFLTVSPKRGDALYVLMVKELSTERGLPADS